VIVDVGQVSGGDGEGGSSTVTWCWPIFVMDSVQFALIPTELAPGAEGTAEVTPEQSGLRIELNATGLPRRDNGEFYQAWLRNDDDQSVPIGTFHDGNGVTL
jgi:hypothetical protein